MIDKSIRQHYEDGEEVNTLTKLKNELMAIPRKKITPTSIAKNVVTRGIGKKLAGTGLLSSLGPIGALLAMFLSRKGMDFASKKWGEGGVGQALASGFAGLGVGSPQEGKELRVLEKRRANMLQRKEEGKNYSENNLSMVTRAIAEAKGIDINNPNEMKNIDKDISNLYSKTITPQVIPKTPEIISPHLLGGDEIITPPKISPISYEDDFATTTIKDLITPIAPIYSNPNEDRAREEAAATQAAAVKAEIDRQERNAAAEAAAAARASVSVPVPAHISGGGGNGGQSQSSSSGGGYSRGDYGGRGHHWAKGGRVDKALGGRSRDI
jgi:hypothetical protein